MILTEENVALMEKWEDVLLHNEMPAIQSPYRMAVVAQMLENQAGVINETAPGSTTGNVQNYDPVLISMVRRAAPYMLAFDVMGVQPMKMPTGLAFALRARYSDKNGSEALFNEADVGFTGAGPAGVAPGGFAPAVKVATAQGTAGTDIVVSTVVGLAVGQGVIGTSIPANAKIASINAGTKTVTLSAASTAPVAAGAILTLLPANAGGMATSAMEGDVSGEMSMTIEKVTVTAVGRQLKAGYSLELAQDLQAVHGLDADSELSSILSTEVLAEINREVIRTLYGAAKPGCVSGTQNAGIFDLTADSDGRWSAERYKGLVMRLELEANRIAVETRRSKANVMITSPDVAAALAMAGVLSDGKLSNENLIQDWTQSQYMGKLNGRIDVWVDPYADSNFAILGYKGPSASDAGLFYCPYVPLQLVRATDPASFTPRMAFKTRYGMVENPFVQSASANQSRVGSVTMRANPYYRTFAITGL